MRIKLPLLFLLAFVCSGLKAQLSQYYFIPSQGSYTPITGTVATYRPFGNSDEGTTGLVPIGFTFRYNGTDYSQMDLCTNGFVQLGSVIDLTAGSTTMINLSATYYRNILAPLWDDVIVGSPGGIRYETSGTAPNRVFTVQWSNVKWDYSSPDPVIEFQLKLYETSNRIEFIYNQLAAPPKSAAAMIGLNVNGSGSGSFLSLNNAGPSPTLNSDEARQMIVSSKPATGQVYAFFVPMPCSGNPVGGTTKTTNELICPSSDFKLSVDGSTFAKNITYQWQSSADGNNWQNIAAATDTNLTRQQTVDTWYRRGITCGGNTAYSSPVLVKTGVLPVNYATLPFTENFETTWLSNCAVRERPSLYITNSVPAGNRSWRRDDDEASGDWTTDGFQAFPAPGTSRAARFRVRDEFSVPVHTTGDLDVHVDCSPAGTKELRFKHIQSVGAKALTIWYSNNGGLNFTALGAVMGWGVWKDQHFVIPSNSANTVVRFRGQGAGYTGASDLGVDNIEVQVVTCNYPTGLTITDLQQTSSRISWTGDAGATYEVKLTNIQEQPVGDVQLVTGTQVELTGLNPANDYFVYIRRKCSETNFSSWSMIGLTPSADCGTATAISCASPATFFIDNGYGRYNMWLTDTSNNCGGGGGYGKEKLFRFIPQVSGTYRLKLTINAGYDVTWYLKDAAQGCGAAGWTCLGTTATSTIFNMGNLTAGKEYYLLVDLYTIVNATTQTIEIECAAVNPDCVTGAVTPAGPLMVCEGTSQLLTVSGGTGWQWFRNGALISGANAATYTATQSGKYVVAVTNGSCTMVSNAVTIDPLIITAPVVTAAGNTALCTGESAQLSFMPVSGYTYQWQKDGADINGATNATFTATAAGLYTVVATGSSCPSAPSNGIQVTLNATPAKPVITAGGATSFCQGGNVVLTSSAVTGNQWYKDGVAVAGAQTYTANASGNYTVKTTQSGCTSETSTAITVTVKNLPPVPTITVGNANALSSSAASGNQWYRDDIIIAGATGQIYTATASGLYTVKVTVDGCTSTSAALNHIVLGIVDPSAWGREVIVYPNPVGKDLFIRNSRSRQLHLKLLDMTGRTVYEGSQSANTGVIELQRFRSGVYQLQVTDLRKKETILLRIVHL